MPWDGCKNEVIAAGNVMCTQQLCQDRQAKIDNQCHTSGMPTNSPFMVVTDSGDCFCCCSCLAYFTPVAVAEDEFKFIQDFVQGDPVLSAGLDLNWQTRTVDFSSGVLPESTGNPFMVSLQYQSGEELPQLLICTEDQLLLNVDKLLVPAGVIRGGDKLITASGDEVTVLFAVSGDYQGGVHHISVGTFDNSTIEGHLLNTNGIVSADFSVQLSNITGEIDPALMIADLNTRLKVGTEEYEKQYSNSRAAEFVADPKQWPQGFTAINRTSLVNIPPGAYGYLTDEQSQELLDSDAPKRDYTSQTAIYYVDFLFQQFQGFFPDTVYILDWDNPRPNAYSWLQSRQRFIVMTGGLARLYALNLEGMAMIISHHLATFYGKDMPNGIGVECVGPADYYGLQNIYRYVWRENYFRNSFPLAYQQVEKMFSYITHSSGGTDKCNNPGLDCRLLTLQAAAASADLPPCADPTHMNDFQVVEAVPSSGEVRVVFNHNLNVDTAETKENYTISPTVEVQSAVLDTGDAVILSAAIDPGVAYTLTVENVLSADGELLMEGGNTAQFELP